MSNQDVLVPIDFSASSLRALDYALEMAGKEGEIYLLHVVDSDLVARLVDEGFGEADDIVGRLRQRAEERMKGVLEGRHELGERLKSLIAVGKPFAEILKLSREMDFDLMVLARQGRRMGDIEALLFGSTAEKVLRGARIPVLFVPNAGVAARSASESGETTME